MSEGGETRRGGKSSAGEGPRHWFFDGPAVQRTPDGVRPVIIELTFAPGPGAPLHHHVELDDNWYVLSGRVAIRCGEDTFLATAGDCVILPARVPHTFFVLDGKPATVLQTHADDSFLRFIRAVGIPMTKDAPPPGWKPNFPAVAKAAAENGQPVMGPPMQEEEALAIAARAR